MTQALLDRPSIIRSVLGNKPGIFLTCLFVWILTNMDQSLFSYAIPGILTEFQLPLESIGTILTISFLVAAVLIVPAGMAADRWGRGGVLVALLVLSALMVGLQGLAGGIVSLTILRALGFGLSGGLSPITNTIVVENAPPRYRGIAMGLLQCGYPLGWLLASLLAAPILASHGWRATSMIALLVVPLGIPIFLLFRHFGEIKRKAPRAVSLQKPANRSGKEIVRLLFSAEHRRTSIASIVIFFTFGGAYAGSAFFFPTFFAQARGYTPADAAALVGLSNGIAVFGYLGAAVVGEFLLTRRNVFAIWCVAGAIALLGLLWVSTSPTQDLIWYALTAALFFGSQAVVAVFVAELFPGEIRATALAICASAPLSIGFAVFPQIVPMLVAQVGWSAGLTIIVFPLLLIAGATALLLPNRKSGLEIE